MSRNANGRISMLAIVCGIGMVCPSLRANEYDDAEKSAKSLLSYYDDFRKLDMDETLRLVRAISDADDEERRSVAERASRNAMDRVNSEFSKVERNKDEAIKLLNAVLNNQALREKFSDTQRLIREVNDKFQKISEMRTNLKPVDVYLSKAGEDMEKSRHGGCRAYEFETGYGKADKLRHHRVQAGQFERTQ
jgi:hypothetical protein